MTTAETAWVAGVFEGEGTIRVRKGNYGAQVSIRMDDQDVIERIHAIMGFGNFYETPERRTSGKVVTQYNYQCGSAGDVIAFLTAVMPWLGARRRARAEQAIASARLTGNNYAHEWTPERRAKQAATWARKREEATLDERVEAAMRYMQARYRISAVPDDGPSYEWYRELHDDDALS